ncbi:MAG TPA: hypothetical protein VFY84_16580 [Jiangellales bacterium]|nr:hypothetical protein [Jiangellales bacterium]
MMLLPSSTGMPRCCGDTARDGSGPHLAEDVVAEVFLVVASHPDRIGPDDSAKAWLYGIATILLRAHRRAELRALRALARSGLDPLGSARRAVLCRDCRGDGDAARLRSVHIAPFPSPHARSAGHRDGRRVVNEIDELVKRFRSTLDEPPNGSLERARSRAPAGGHNLGPDGGWPAGSRFQPWPSP